MLKNANMTNEEAKNYLINNRDEKYKTFHQALIPNVSCTRVLGVRVPVIRKLAKTLAKDNQIYYGTYYHEEIMLYGLTIAYSETDINSKLELFDKFLPYCCSWSITDTVFQGVKDFTKKENKQVVFDYCLKNINSSEYTVRSMVVILFRYFLDDNYIDKVINVYKNIVSDKYYINMAISWGIAEILAKYFDKGLALIKENSLPVFIHNMAIKKAQESYKISEENKKILKGYKR